MATKSKATKAVKSEVKVTAPKIAKAWVHVVEVSAKNETENINAIISLVSEMDASQLSIRDIMKVIKDTNRESAVLKVSHVEGLKTWSEMRGKFAEFVELPLTSQLAKATAAYKLLGSGKAENLKSLEVVEREVKVARKAKSTKAKQNPTGAAKKTATTTSTLENIVAFVKSLDPATLTDADIDLINDLSDALMEVSVGANA